MKIVKPGIEIMEQDESLGLEGALRHIERIGRVCYKSEDKITEDSYKKFVRMLEDKGHGAMLEHGTLYLKVSMDEMNSLCMASIEKYSSFPDGSDWVNITTNYRAVFESGYIKRLLNYMTVPNEKHERRVSIKFTCDRGVSHEFVRNRGKLGNAFAQESTRYCDYNKGEGVVYCYPVWLKKDELPNFEFCLKQNESRYIDWRIKGWSPQQARGFLAHFLKTELIITAFMSDWKHFLSLRAAPSAHPSAQELAYMVKEEFEKRGYL